MRSLALVAVLAGASLTTATQVASAEPRNMSQNPRVGLLADIRFSEGSSRLPDASGSQLGRVAAWAEENFDGLVVLDGHADRDGRSRGSVKLSLQRARRVRDQLLGLGVDPNQIVITAFGSEGRRHARVQIWGTHNSLEQVIAMRRNAPVVRWGADPVAPGPTLAGRR
jgi:outer membrane protein OmpA-like peptidoglycan-associated protein